MVLLSVDENEGKHRFRDVDLREQAPQQALHPMRQIKSY